MKQNYLKESQEKYKIEETLSISTNKTTKRKKS